MKTFQGKVISLRNKKTIVVRVERQMVHPLYKKFVKRSRNVKAHYEGNELKAGDMVEIVEARPISKDKHFKFVKAL